MDRKDRSQYRQVSDGNSYNLGATAVTDDEIQHHPDSHYAALNEVMDYHNPDVVGESFPVGDSYARHIDHRAKRSQPRTVFASGVLVPFASKILGWNFKETSGAGTASVTIYQGQDANQQPLLYITLAANESMRDFIQIPIEAQGGIYVGITGSAVGIVYTEEYRNE